MINLRQQAELLRKIRRQADQVYGGLIKVWQIKYLFNFFKKYRTLVISSFLLLVLQGLIEIGLMAVSRFQFGWELLGRGRLFWLLLAGLVIIFALVAYFALRLEKTFSVILANDIRRRLLKSHLKKSLQSMGVGSQADLLAKIVYQIPLASMGVSNSFFGAVRWFVYFVIIGLISYWAGLSWWIIILSLLFLSIIIARVAFFISSKYVAQETTFYSKLIKYLDINLNDKYFLKYFNQERVVLNEFDEIVAMDSYFRIRRDIWLKMSSRLLFVLLIILIILLRINFDKVSFLINWQGDGGMLWLFLLIYLSRLANESLRIGLYWLPGKLGLSLTVVKSTSLANHRKNKAIIKELIFSSPKTKLFKNGHYYRRLNLSFKAGDRVLFVGPNLSGKTSLANLLAGRAVYLARSININWNSCRMGYEYWRQNFNGAYLINRRVSSGRSLMEFMLAKDRRDIDFIDIEKALMVLNSQPIIFNLLAQDGNFNHRIDSILDNDLSLFALHAAHCLINQPSLIVIDNFWLDLAYDDIIVILNILNQALPQSIIICFSGKTNDYLNYRQRYEIGPNQINQIKN